MDKRISIFFVAFCICLVSSPPVSAFKIDTHVWLSQQVLNDILDDGRVTISPFGEFRVSNRLVNALRNHPNEFRMGSIGPDAFPDLVGGQQTVHPGVPNGWNTDRWLEWMLDSVGPENSSANSERQLAFAYGYLNHAAADVFAHTYVNTYAGDMFSLLDGQEVELRHMALEEFIKKHMPPVRDNANNVLNPHQVVSAPAAFLRDILVLNPTVAAEYRKQPGTLYLALMYDYWKAIGDVITEIQGIKDDANSVIDSIQSEIDNLQDHINSLKDIRVNLGFTTVNLYPAYCFIDPATCLLILSTSLTLEVTQQSLEIPQAVNALAMLALEEPLRAWRGEVEEAIKQYMITSQNVAIELMRPGGNPRAQIEDWVCEWAPVFAGVPNEVSWPACATNSAIARVQAIHTQVSDGINGFRDYVADKLGVFGWVVDPGFQIQQLVDNNVKQPFEDFALQIAESLLTTATGEDSLTLDILTFRTETQTEAKLNSIFSGDSSGKGLLLIPDVAQRVKSEMHLDINGYWDPDQYSVVHNAIVLSKLVMLDSSQLNLLVKRAGIDQTIYGTDLYNSNTFKNILVGAIASIDGDHQWQEYPPDYPRTTAAADNGVAEEHYGYPHSYLGSNQYGFRLWQDCEARDLVFKRIFSGPVSTGLEVPSLLGLAPIANYANPSGVTEDNPFPLSYRSSLDLKALTEDPDFTTSGWLREGSLSTLLDFTRYTLPGTALSPVDLPVSHYVKKQQLQTSAENLVLELSAQACGGDLEQGISVKWGFKEDCLYTCVCEDYLWFNPVTRQIEIRTACNCSSPVCGELPTMNTPYDMAGYGLVPATSNDCGMCHASAFSLGLTAGTYQASTKYVPGVSVGNGIEYDGSLICDVNAIQTKLIMKPVDTKDINVIVTDNSTGERAVSSSPRSTNYPELVGTYNDWRDVNAAILASTNNQADACGFPQISDEASFEADVLPPELTVPANVTLSCAELNSLIAGGSTVQDIIGQASAIDNRDPDVQTTNDAPLSLSAGDTIINWTAVDDANNSVVAAQLVRITDAQSPIFPATPPAIEVTATNPGGTPVFLPPPVAQDACEGSIPASTTSNLFSMPSGVSTVNWTAMDTTGNSATVSQLITVKVLFGDLNIDGMVDFTDLSLLAIAVGNPVITETVLRDYDLDGDIDALDQQTFDLIRNGEHDPYDLNKDYSINELDARLLVGLITLSPFTDVDGDGANDATDNCIVYVNPNQFDKDNDGFGDICDKFPTDTSEWADSDGDGVGNNADAFPTDPTETTDTDGDNKGDNSDNCTSTANELQRDTDLDGFGNYCDPDFDNNLIVNAADLAYMKTRFFRTGLLAGHADLNGDSVVNAADLAILKRYFFKPPGPSAVSP